MNQNTQVNKSIQLFSIASFVLGILSVILSCTIIIPLVGGCLGILFALLSRRTGLETNAFNHTGMALSIVGIVLAFVMIGLSVYFVIIPVLTDPVSFQEYDTLFRRNYGMPLVDFIKTIYPDFVEPGSVN